MSNYLKPQTPIKQGDDYIYPLTTADQVMVGNGGRLSSLFRKTINITINLLASNWSESTPYTQVITVDDDLDDYKVDANVIYNGNKENDIILNKAASCLSYIKKNGKEITFFCLKNKPEIDIFVEIVCVSKNTIANIGMGNGIELPVLENEGTAEDLLLGKQMIDQEGNIVTGTIVNVEPAVPDISVDSNGLITASTTQNEGYVEAGTKSGTHQLVIKPAATITPSTSEQVAVESGVYTTGAITVAGDADLVAGNIKNGVDIFGVTGTYEGVKLNFEVVGGTSAPASPKENTIWVNTDVEITSYSFKTTKPGDSEGRVWIQTGSSSNVSFDAIEKNWVWVYPISAKQYVNGAWVDKTAKSYQNGEWVDWATYLYENGNEFSELTGNFSMTYSNNKGTTTVTKNTDNLYLLSKGSTGSGANFMVYTGKTVNLTDFSTLYARITFTNTKSTRVYIGVNTVNNAMPTQGCFATTNESISDTLSLDVSNMSGEYYIGIGLGGTAVSNEGSCYVYEMYLK